MNLQHTDSLRNELAVIIRWAGGFPFCSLSGADWEKGCTRVSEAWGAMAVSGFPDDPANWAEVKRKASPSSN